jgi:hypothetical protein
MKKRVNLLEWFVVLTLNVATITVTDLTNQSRLFIVITAAYTALCVKQELDYWLAPKDQRESSKRNKYQ